MGSAHLSGGAKCAKFSLIFFNIIFFLLAIGILAVGIYVLVDPKFNHFKNIASIDVVNKAAANGINLSYISYCGIAFCVFGGVMLLISFLGCCGALKNVKCLLGLYATMLLLILIAEIGIGIFSGVYSGKLRDLLAPQLQKNIQKEYMGDARNKTFASIGWDTIMLNFECCGVNNYTDFTNATNWNTNNALTPRACCKFKSLPANSWGGSTVPTNYVNDDCYNKPNDNISNWNTGCYNKIQQTVVQYSTVIIGVAVGVGLALLLGVILGFHLCRKIGNGDEYDY